MMERVTREDARVVCSDPHAVKRFQVRHHWHETIGTLTVIGKCLLTPVHAQDLSRCVQKKVRDLFQSLGSGMSNAGPVRTTTRPRI